MKFVGILTAVTVAGLVFGAYGAAITAATYDVDISAPANTDGSGNVTVPVSWTSVVVGGATYTRFDFGETNDPFETIERYYPQGHDPGADDVALRNSIVNDGILNVREGTQVIFDRAMTAGDLIVVTDLEPDGDTSHSEDEAGIGLVDASGNRIATAKLVDVGVGGSNLLNFEAEFEEGDVDDYDLYGSAYGLSTFDYDPGVHGKAWGIEFTSDRDTDVSMVTLASIPEPATGILLAMTVAGCAGRQLLARRI